MAEDYRQCDTRHTGINNMRKSISWLSLLVEPALGLNPSRENCQMMRRR